MWKPKSVFLQNSYHIVYLMLAPHKIEPKARNYHSQVVEGGLEERLPNCASENASSRD